MEKKIDSNFIGKNNLQNIVLFCLLFFSSSLYSFSQESSVKKSSDEALNYIRTFSENDSKNNILCSLIKEYESMGVFFVSDEEYYSLIDKKKSIYPISYLLLSSIQKVYKEVRDMKYNQIEEEIILKKIKEYSNKGVKVLSTLDWMLFQNQISMFESNNIDNQDIHEKISFLKGTQISLVEFLKSNF